MVFLVKPVGKVMRTGDSITGSWKVRIMKELW